VFNQRSRHALVWLCLGLCCLVGCRSGAPGSDRAWPKVTLTPQDRVLVLAPHPDDESLACGGIIQQAVAMDIPVHVVFLTYGDNNQWSFAVYRKRPELGSQAVESMGLMRHDEAIAAADVLGLHEEQLTFLGYPDFGTLDIWYAHWGDRPPFLSMLTRVTEVPYANAFRPGAPYKGDEILADLTTVLRDFRPTKIFLSHPTDHNPDHQSLYLFTHVALWDLGSELEPELYPYLVHYPDWPTPLDYHPNDSVQPPPDLVERASWQTVLLDRQTIDRKRAALQQHRSQYEVSHKLLDAFVRTDELFGDLPVVPLQASAPDAGLATDGMGQPARTLDALNETEQAAFVGVEWRTVKLDGSDLAVSLDFSRPLAHDVRASVYVFGYRSDRRFQEMPKLHVRLGEGSHALLDQDRELSPDAWQIDRSSEQVTLRLPLALLGDPQRILIGARTYLGGVSLDWVSWRVLDLSGG
jgi:LmbE family N-acetylglucosaminyl deacetylase